MSGPVETDRPSCEADVVGADEATWLVPEHPERGGASQLRDSAGIPPDFAAFDAVGDKPVADARTISTGPFTLGDRVRFADDPPAPEGASGRTGRGNSARSVRG